jgi:hypothetical protein
MSYTPVLRRWVGLGVLAIAAAGCATAKPCPPPPEPAPSTVGEIEIEVHRRAETERAAQLAKQVERLRADLAQAEEALVIAESGLSGDHTRAGAASSLAETRIQVERAAERAPWRAAEVEEARAKLAEANRQIAEGHYGSALFFVYRAQRIAENIEVEATRVRQQPEVRFVGATLVNMRSGPSTHDPVLRTLAHGTPVFAERGHAGWVLVRASTGDVGWVHQSLLQRP